MRPAAICPGRTSTRSPSARRSSFRLPRRVDCGRKPADRRSRRRRSLLGSGRPQGRGDRPLDHGADGTNAKLTFDAFWNEELGWDFGFAQISDDGGATYTSLSCTDTTSDHDPDALPTAVENVPGFTGFSGTFRPQVCSLADYAGQTVLLAFRAFNDPATLGATMPACARLLGRRRQGRPTLISDGSTLAGLEVVHRGEAEHGGRASPIWIVSIDTKKKDGDITLRQLQLNVGLHAPGKAKVRQVHRQEGRLRRRDRLLRRPDGERASSTRRTR